MASKITILVDGEPFGLHPMFFSRTVWLTAALAMLNLYQEIGDPATLAPLLGQFGIVLTDRVVHGINAVGALLALYFRVRARQPLAVRGRLERLSPDELAQLKELLQRDIDAGMPLARLQYPPASKVPAPPPAEEVRP